MRTMKLTREEALKRVQASIDKKKHLLQSWKEVCVRNIVRKLEKKPNILVYCNDSTSH